MPFFGSRSEGSSGVAIERGSFVCDGTSGPFVAEHNLGQRYVIVQTFQDGLPVGIDWEPVDGDETNSVQFGFPEDAPPVSGVTIHWVIMG